MTDTIERAFKIFGPTWPSWPDDSYSSALTAWRELSDDERKEAVRLADTHNRTCSPCALGSYLKYKKWQGLEVIVVPVGKEPVVLFGKVWGVLRLAALRRGAQPATGRHFTDVARWRVMYPYVSSLDGGMVRSIELARVPSGLDGCCRVRVGSAEWHAWAAYHVAQDWPMVRPGASTEWVWFPALRPEGWVHYRRESGNGGGSGEAGEACDGGEKEDAA